MDEEKQNQENQKETNSEPNNDYKGGIGISEEEQNRLELNQTAMNDLSKQAKYAQGLAYIPGIYGYITDTDGEKITLSLTPYEVSPRLSDSSIFTVKNVDERYKQIDKPITSTGEKALKTAMTVGNRLSAARVVTNFMQEVLSPEQDKRFGSKDDRVGQLSRFLDNSGEEQDRSAFLHIVPDVEATGGKIPILYNKFDKDGNLLGDKPAVAYVPVNFNFISQKYTLTIKEFILTNVNESSQEVYSLDKTFDGVNLRFFGQQPKIFTFSGMLTNFDDDIIGIDEDTSKILQWDGTSNAGGFTSPKMGSQRDVFMAYYQNFLAGTKCKDFSIKVYLYYNFRILEGYMINLSINTSSENDNVVTFGANMIIRREYSVYEAGKGLGFDRGSLSYLKRNQETGIESIDANNKEVLGFFDQDRTYRLNYRTFALQRSREVLQLTSEAYNSKTNEYSDSNFLDNYTDEQKNFYANNSTFAYDDNIYLNGELKHPNEKAWFYELITQIISGIKTSAIAGINVSAFNSVSEETIAIDAYEKYFSSNKDIDFDLFVSSVIKYDGANKSYYAVIDPNIFPQTSVALKELLIKITNTLETWEDAKNASKTGRIGVLEGCYADMSATGTGISLIEVFTRANQKFYSYKENQNIAEWVSKFNDDGTEK